MELSTVLKYNAPTRSVLPSLSNVGAEDLEPKYLSSKASYDAAALVSEVAAAVAELAALVAEVEALLAEVDAADALLLALVSLVEAALADEAALVA
jgi:hypothetical protein